MESLAGPIACDVKPVHKSATILIRQGIVQMPLRDVLRDFPLAPHRLIAASNHKPDGNALNSLVVDCRGNTQILFAQAEIP